MANDTKASPGFFSRHKPSPKWANYAIFSVTLFMATLGGIYAMYVLNQMDYYAARNFRLLSAWSQQLSATLANYEQVFASAHAACFQLDFLVTGSSRRARPLSPSAQTVEPVSARNCLERIHAALPSSLKPVTSRPTMGSFPLHAFWVDVVQRSSAAGSSVMLTYLSEIRLKKVEANQHENTICRLIPRSTKAQPEASGKPMLLCQAAISLKRLTAQLGIGAEQVFDEIVLTDQTGRVHYQHGASRFQFVSLRPWIHSARSSESAGAPSSTTGQPSDGAESLAARLPLRQKVDVGGIRYHLFAQPVLLPAHGAEVHADDHAEHPHYLIIAGFVKTDRFNQHAFAIPYTVLLLIVFIVLVLTVSLPFLKLKTMGLRDRIRQADVITAMGTCLLATALLTFFLLDTYAYWRIKEQKDQELKTFAHALAENVRAEIEKTAGWMTTLNQQVCNSIKEARDHAPFFGQPLRANILQGPTPRLPELEQHPYPDPIMIFWVDRHGQQRAKWTVRTRPTPLINIANREYVRQAQQDELWKIRDSRGIRHRLWIEPIYSRTTGEFSVVVSTRTATDCPAFNRQYPVTAMQIRLSSVMQPVVPPGFGFAVVQDRDGLVLFHTKKWRALRENFFEETDHNPALAALMFSRTSDGIGGRYWGVGHRFYVKPLNGLPWTLVTYMKKDPLRTFNFEVLVVSASFFLCYAGGFLVLVLLLGLTLGAIKKGQAGWLWPRADYQDRYHLIIGVNGILALGFFLHFALDRSDWTWMLGWAVLIPVGATTALSFVLTRSQCRFARFAPPFVRDHRRSYAVMVTSLLLVLSLIPAVALFTIAHDAEMELLVKHGQLGLARAMDERDRHLRAFYRNIKIGRDEEGHGRDWRTFLATRRGLHDPHSAPGAQRPRDVYADFLFQDSSHTGTTIQKRGSEHPGCPPSPYHKAPSGSDVDPVMDEAVRTLWFKARALFNAPSRETAGIILHHPHDPPFRWEAPAPGCVSLVFHDLQVTSFVPALTLPSFKAIFEWQDSSVFSSGAAVLLSSIVLALLVLAFWLVLYRLPRFVADKVFLLSFDQPVDWEELRCLIRDSTTPQPHLLMIGPPGSGKSQFVKDQGWHCIDIRAINDESDWLSTTPVSDALQSKDRRTVAIDHYEYGMGAPGHDLKKLALLEAALATGKRVCVISSVNPLDLAALTPSSDEEKPAATEELTLMSQRVTRIFQAFMIVHHPLRRGYGMCTMGEQTGAWRQQLGVQARAMVEEEQETLLQPHYRAIWSTSPDAEKIALFHLAKDRFLHAENPTLRTLLRKGLVTLDPDLRLISDGFRQFILAAAQDEQVVQFEQRTPGSFWQTLSWPLGIALLLLVLFLILTQEHVQSAAGASLSLLPAILPVLLKIFGALQKQKTGG